MNIEQRSISELVRMMLRGIQTEHTIDPVASANHFEHSVQSNLGLEYVHQYGMGYVLDGDDGVMYVHFTPDGVEFDDHHEHPQTLRVIHCVLNTLTHMEMQTVIQDDDDSDDFTWV